MLVTSSIKHQPISGEQYEALQAAFGERLQTQVLLARFMVSRVGGPADALITVETVEELSETVERLWTLGVPFVILGGGSNVLVSDTGIHKLVIVNRARQVVFDQFSEPPSVWAGSGTNFGLVARQAASRSLAGLEWAAGIPGTVGGAVFGNAGAHGSDVADCLLVAEILHREKGRITWSVDQFEYSYRSSLLKREPVGAVILSAQFRLENSTPILVQARLDEYGVYRRRTQPPGASMGSMFKNPPGDYAGRLIENAGLKGMRIGDAEISHLHANFFVNQGEASAADIYALIQLARRTVADEYGVELELEIELIGDWAEINEQ
jgi:UDP-N-acetylmuramate dehydrogenase